LIWLLGLYTIKNQRKNVLSLKRWFLGQKYKKYLIY
jgi:hypothetical protein